MFTGCFVFFTLITIKTLFSDLSDIVYSYCLAFTLFSALYITSLQGIIHPLSIIIIIIILNGIRLEVYYLKILVSSTSGPVAI